MVTDFYQDLNPQALDTQCASELKRPPLFFLQPVRHHDHSKNIAKSFGDVHAVQSVSFTALDGQITGLLELQMVAGKSTTIR